jgi:hypothetical protein
MSQRVAVPGVALAAVLALGACETPRGVRSDSGVALARPVSWGYAAAPFSVEQLQEGCRPGRSSTYHMEIANRSPYFEVTRYVKANEAEVHIESQRLSASGAPRGNQVKAHSTWKAMSERGWYPDEWTVITDERVETPAGAFDCRVYEVTSHGETVDRYYFARDLPGPPVLHTRHVDGALQLTMTLVEHTPAP